MGEEKDVSMLQLMDPSELEDSKDEDEPTFIYTTGDDTYISAPPQLTLFYAIPMPLSHTCQGRDFRPCERRLYPYFLRRAHCVRFMAMLHSGCIIRGLDGQMVEVPWCENGLNGIKHETRKVNSDAERHTLHRQTRQIV